MLASVATAQTSSRCTYVGGRRAPFARGVPPQMVRHSAAAPAPLEAGHVLTLEPSSGSAVPDAPAQMIPMPNTGQYGAYCLVSSSVRERSTRERAWAQKRGTPPL